MVREEITRWRGKSQDGCHVDNDTVEKEFSVLTHKFGRCSARGCKEYQIPLGGKVSSERFYCRYERQVIGNSGEAGVGW